MANARQCDVCGSYFSIPKADLATNMADTMSKSVTLIVVDLCTTCRANLFFPKEGKIDIDLLITSFKSLIRIRNNG